MTTLSRILCASLLITALGCGRMGFDPLPAEGDYCDEIELCAVGAACVDNMCLGMCSTQADCSSVESVCNGQYCLLAAESVCGDGQLEAGEQCDDGNSDNGDGCSTLCLAE